MYSRGYLEHVKMRSVEERDRWRSEFVRTDVLGPSGTDVITLRELSPERKHMQLTNQTLPHRVRQHGS